MPIMLPINLEPHSPNVVNDHSFNRVGHYGSQIRRVDNLYRLTCISSPITSVNLPSERNALVLISAREHYGSSRPRVHLLSDTCCGRVYDAGGRRCDIVLDLDGLNIDGGAFAVEFETGTYALEAPGVDVAGEKR